MGHGHITFEHNEIIGYAKRFLNSCLTYGRPMRNDSLDQCPATFNTVLRRLQLLMDDGVFPNGRCLLLGDDDLLSLAIMGGYPQAQVTIVDLDEELLTYLAERIHFNVAEFIRADLRDGLPHALRGKFDTVFTDPPYTLFGQLLFLHRAVQAMKPIPSASLYLCFSRLYLESSDVSQLFNFAEKAGLELMDIREDFNQYAAPPIVLRDMAAAGYDIHSVPFTSSLLRFSPGSGFSVPRLPADSLGDIYDYEGADDSA